MIIKDTTSDFTPRLDLETKIDVRKSLTECKTDSTTTETAKKQRMSRRTPATVIVRRALMFDGRFWANSIVGIDSIYRCAEKSLATSAEIRARYTENGH